MLKFLKVFWVDLIMILALISCLYLDHHDGKNVSVDIFWLCMMISYFVYRIYIYVKYS